MLRKATLLAERVIQGFFAGTTVALAAGMLIVGGGAMISRKAAAAPVSPAAPVTLRAASIAGAGDVRMADEIIRELRRLGLNLVPERIDRPYDPKGELC